MKKIAVTLFALIISLCIQAQAQKEVLEELDAYVQRTSSNLGNCPYAIVVSKEGEIIYEKYSDGGGALGEITAASKWQLFSITKSFVSAVMLRLDEQGVINLDDHVSKYLPAFKNKGSEDFDRREVTIRNLASHTSGAALDGDKRPSGYPEDLTKIDIVTEPGKDFLYSGLGMHLLEMTLEAATGRDLGELVKELVTDPIGLNSVSYVYSKDDPNGPVLPLRPGSEYYSVKGSRAGTGLFSTARDLNKFGQFWFSPEKLFSKNLRQEAWSWHGTRDSDGGKYGLLWWLLEDQGGYVMSGRQYKINALIPANEVVITVIRLPQEDEPFEFWKDKLALVTFGTRL